MKPITVRLPEQVLDALNAHMQANSLGDTKLTHSMVIRDALIQYLHIEYSEPITRGGARPGAGRPPSK